jgi:epoxyqueuosine reductase
MSEREARNLQGWVKSLVIDFMIMSTENNLQNHTGEQAFERPLVGFSAGDDPLYEAYRELVGPFHWTPEEIFGFSPRPERPREITERRHSIRPSDGPGPGHSERR